MAERPPPGGNHTSMSAESFAQQWAQVRRELKRWWDQLTETDLEQIAGKKDQLVALVQEKYRYTWERAQQEVDRHLQAYCEQLEASGVRRMGETVTTTAQDMASHLAETVGEVRAKAQETATATAGAVTDTVKGAGAYLHEKGLAQLTGDLAALISRYPITSLLVGLGLGFLLARSLGKGRTSQGS